MLYMLLQICFLCSRICIILKMFSRSFSWLFTHINCGNVVNTFISKHFTINLQQQKFQETNSTERLNTKQLTRNIHKILSSISTYLGFVIFNYHTKLLKIFKYETTSVIGKDTFVYWKKSLSITRHYWSSVRSEQENFIMNSLSVSFVLPVRILLTSLRIEKLPLFSRDSNFTELLV